MKVLWKRLGC